MFNNEDVEFQAASEPVITRHTHSPDGHNYIVESICDQIKDEMIHSGNLAFHLAWVAVDKDGVVKTNVVTDRHDIINVSHTETTLKDPASAMKLYNRMADQMFISADYIGHSDFPMVELNIGDQDKETTGLINFPISHHFKD